MHHGIAMLHSLYASNQNHKIVVHILDGGISFKNRLKLFLLFKRLKFKFKFYKIDYSKIINAPISNHISFASYNRIFLSTAISSRIDKILYLDCDLIVLKDISSFFEFNLENYYLGAVCEIVDEETKNRLELGKDFQYFNAGVQIVNLKKWRDENFEKTLVNFITKNKGKIISHDQDVLNFCAKGNWLMLDFKYNVTHFFYYPEKYPHEFFNIQLEEYQNVKKEAIIVHFTSQDKPWTLESTHPEKDLYFKYLLSYYQLFFKRFNS